MTSAERIPSDQRNGRGPRRRLAIVAAGLLLLLGVGALLLPRAPAVFSWQRSGYQSPGPPSTLSDIQDIDQLATLFNEDEGTPRLILLFAPT